VTDIKDNLPATPPSASGPTGASLEAHVGAFYMLSLLTTGEPRGLPGATITTVKFQQAAHGRPFDDVIIDAVNADGSPAFLDIQGKRTIDFTKSNDEFADVVKRLWATAQLPQWTTARYETAVAVARTSTRIARHCQEVLRWARQLSNGDTFAAHMQMEGFSSVGMRGFLEAFKHHLAAAGASTDNETVWQLLRRFQILVFDFDEPGSDFAYRARERARMALVPDQAARAADLWSSLIEEALAYDTAGGVVDRPSLIRKLAEEHAYRFHERPDLRIALQRLAEATDDALADISDHIGDARLSRVSLIDEAHQALEQTRLVQIVGAGGVGKSSVLKALATDLRPQGRVVVLTPGRIIGGGWLKMADALGCAGTRNELLNELGIGGAATLFIENIDQIDDDGVWLTLNDLLRGVIESPGWRAVYTVRSDDTGWHTRLPENVRKLPVRSIRVGEITDADAEVLSSGNPALAALLSPTHPARSIARNLFHLSRMIGLVPADGSPPLVNEVDLAGMWWKFGGGRSDSGKWERLKLLRDLGTQLIQHPSRVSFNADGLHSPTVAELLHLEGLRENRAGATVSFWHDTLRDWTLAFMLHDQPELLDSLPTDRPLPGAISRSIEIAARLALRDDPTGNSWLALLAHFEREGRHGSWRRPVFLTLLHSENALQLLFSVTQGFFQLPPLAQHHFNLPQMPDDLLRRVPLPRHSFAP
jgi:hypothetical protein